MTESDQPTTVMQVYPTEWQSSHRRGFKPSSTIVAFKSSGLVARVVVSPDHSWDRISSGVVRQLESAYPEVFSEYMDGAEDNFRELRLRLRHGDNDLPLTFIAWLDAGEKIGDKLPSGVDIALGASTIWRARVEMRRRAYLGSSAHGFNPVFKGRDFTVNPDFCFVLMPFGEQWSDRVWRRHIKPSVESTGLQCRRVDDFFAPTVIMEDVWRAINTANVIVADLTGRNPNVFYELGIAHVVGAPVILLSQDHEVPAFDTAHWRQIRYQDNSDGCELLEKQLRKAIEAVLGRMRFP